MLRAGTGDCFGASAAASLRKQLEAARAVAKARSQPASSSSSAPARPVTSASSSQPMPDGAVWLCFPCMQKRGEKSPRIDNDVEKRRCAECSECPQGIYKIDALPSCQTSASATADSATSSSPVPSMRKSRAYAPTLRQGQVNVDLARFFSTRESEPVSLSALEAGAGGD